jgi:hypothetical protein
MPVTPARRRIDSSELLPELTRCLAQFACRRIVRREQHNVTRQISMPTRKELVEALWVRYRSAAFCDRIKILDEFVALTGYCRKHAIRVLREEVATAKAACTRNRLYDGAVPVFCGLKSVGPGARKPLILLGA